jgi:hypothetical protein
MNLAPVYFLHQHSESDLQTVSGPVSSFCDVGAGVAVGTGAEFSAAGCALNPKREIARRNTCTAVNFLRTEFSPLTFALAPSAMKNLRRLFIHSP